jgi:hypothetical protein
MTQHNLEAGLEGGADLALWGEDILYHATRLAQGGLDLATLLVLGLLLYLTGVDQAPGGRGVLGLQAKVEVSAGGTLAASHAPSSCGLTNDLLDMAHRSCIHTLVLEPAEL